jgi:hypothetical protein
MQMVSKNLMQVETNRWRRTNRWRTYRDRRMRVQTEPHIKHQTNGRECLRTTASIKQTFVDYLPNQPISSPRNAAQRSASFTQRAAQSKTHLLLLNSTCLPAMGDSGRLGLSTCCPTTVCFPSHCHLLGHRSLVLVRAAVASEYLVATSGCHNRFQYC